MSQNGGDTDLEGMSHGERMFVLKDDPQRYEELWTSNESERQYFEQMTRQAARLLAFSEWVDFLDPFFKQADPEIQHIFENDLARHAKNMILGTGQRGSNFPVGTLSELQAQMDAYEGIGLDVPSVDRIVETTLEHAYDQFDSPLFIVGLCDTLLTEVPNQPSTNQASTGKVDGEMTVDEITSLEHALNYLARARCTARIQVATEPADQIDSFYNEFVQSTLCPTIGGMPVKDVSSAEELLNAADQHPYADDQRLRLCQAALYCSECPPETLFTVLFLTGRNALEDFRHGRNPSRGEMLLAERQLNAIRNTNAPPLEDPEKWSHYVKSAAHVITAIERSSGAFESDRESRPEQVQYQAAFSYLKGAEEIEPVDPERAIKYRSKAFRAAAAADNEPETNVILHECALGWLLRDLTDCGSDLKETIKDTISFHEFARDRAKLHRAYADRDFEDVQRHYNNAMESLDAAPQTYIDTTSLEYRHDVAQARIIELDGEFEQARRAYRIIESDGDHITNRSELCVIKQAVVDGDLPHASEHLEEQFGNPNIVEAALRALNGDDPGETSTNDPYGIALAAVDLERARALAWCLRFVHEGEILDNPFREVIQEHFLQL
jgi:hypothetical protein